MNKDHLPMYVMASVAAVVAVGVGMPVVFLLFLACPLMMLFMMKGMGGMHSNSHTSPPAAAVTPPAEDAKHR